MTQPGPFDLTGQAALVTGAASGLGRAIAEALAEAGASVTLADLDADGLDRAVASLRDKGGRAEGRFLDVADLTALRRTVDDTAKAHGRLDIVFANAGISGGGSIAAPEGASRLSRWRPGRRCCGSTSPVSSRPCRPRRHI